MRVLAGRPLGWIIVTFVGVAASAFQACQHVEALPTSANVRTRPAPARSSNSEDAHLSPPAVVASGTSPQAQASPLLPEESSLGSFRLRLELSAEQVPDFDCAPAISDLAGLANGEVWAVGACGLRGRITPTGFVNMSSSWERRRGRTANLSWACQASAFYFTALARSPAEAYALGETQCGTNPDAASFRPLERFDGRAWLPLVDRSGHAQPNVLAAGPTGPVFGLVANVETGDSTGCAILQLAGGRFQTLRECKNPKSGADGSVERFVSIAVDARGALWVSGERGPATPAGAARSPMLLRYDKGGWSELAFEDRGTLIRGGDQHLWLFGSAVWRESEGAWRREDLLSEHVARAVDVALRSPSDVWWLGQSDIRHFDGQRVSRVKLSERDELGAQVSRLELAGPRVYVSSQLRVWELIGANEMAPAKVRVELAKDAAKAAAR